MTIVQRALLALALIFAAAVPARPDAFEDGVVAYVEGDFASALARWLPLAELGHVRAQYNLGLMYANGYGVPQDAGEAVRWYRPAAERGHSDAQFQLGIIYAEGQGVPRDRVRALMWFNVAAAEGQALARESGDAITRLMTPAQIAEAQRLARDWIVSHPR